MGRYWIFFVIVAVGLVLSWGQIGRKAESRLESTPVVLLATEAGCHLARAPCAAYGEGLAMVARWDARAATIEVRLVGLDPQEVSAARVQVPGRDGELPLAWRVAGSGWAGRLPAAGSPLSVVLETGRRRLVAEFPR